MPRALSSEDIGVVLDLLINVVLVRDLAPVDPPEPAPTFAFLARDGHAHTLADFRGRFVLINLWATWCQPCVREMPSLDRAQAKLGDRLRILAIAEDKRGAEVVLPFLEKLRPSRLAVYLDPADAAYRALKAHAFPTSFLVDPSGRIVATRVGAVEWDSPSMMASLERYLAADDPKTDSISAPR